MNRKSSSSQSSGRRKGLSLLEVILSIAILGTSMAVIYQMLGVGYRSAIEVRARTDGNIFVDTKMAEVAAGVLPLESANGVLIEENPDWEYSVDVSDAEQNGLLSVVVTVQQNNVENPVAISVVRLMADPEYEPEQLEGQ